MAKMQLQMALDFCKRKGVVPGRQAYRHEGKWYLVSYGPTYINSYLVAEFTPEEEEQLKSIERKDEPCTTTGQGNESGTPSPPSSPAP